MKRVVLGYYGMIKDAGTGRRRWNRWRPTISLAQDEEQHFDRFELIHPVGHEEGAAFVAKDLKALRPDLEVVLRPLDFDDPWDFEEVYAGFYEFARSYPFDLQKEEYLFHITNGTHVMQICWFLLAESRHLPVKLLQSSPSKDTDGRGLSKRSPANLRIIDLDLSRYDAIARRHAEEREESLEVLKGGIDTKNAAYNQLIGQIELVALRSEEPILLMGPTGAGKSHLAEQIARLRQQRRLVRGEFVTVNCATIRGDGAMSALFGHVRGAFTGAQGDRKGLLRAANGGVLFLDEIGELGLEEQAMLLRAIEYGRFRPVGTDKEEQVEFQLIAGTNRDLGAEVAAGRFREDLLARIQLWSFTLPGLRERPEDIAPNLDVELQRVESKVGRKVTINREARNRFLRFAKAPGSLWRGNFRDFGAAMLRMATLAPGGRIDVRTVRGEVERLEASWRRPRAGGATRESDDALLSAVIGSAALSELDLFDRVQLAECIRVCRNNATLSDAGRQLFAASRERRKVKNDADRLRKYLARFDLDFDAVQLV